MSNLLEAIESKLFCITASLQKQNYTAQISELFGICNTGLQSQLQGNMMESKSFDLNKQKGVDVAINKKNN